MLLLFVYLIVIVSLSIDETCFSPQLHGNIVDTHRPIQYGHDIFVSPSMFRWFYIEKCASAWLLFQAAYHSQTTGLLLFTQHLGTHTHTNTKTASHAIPVTLTRSTHSSTLAFIRLQRNIFHSHWFPQCMLVRIKCVFNRGWHSRNSQFLPNHRQQYLWARDYGYTSGILCLCPHFLLFIGMLHIDVIYAHLRLISGLRAKEKDDRIEQL